LGYNPHEDRHRFDAIPSPDPDLDHNRFVGP